MDTFWLCLSNSLPLPLQAWICFKSITNYLNLKAQTNKKDKINREKACCTGFCKVNILSYLKITLETGSEYRKADVEIVFFRVGTKQTGTTKQTKKNTNRFSPACYTSVDLNSGANTWSLTLSLTRSYVPMNNPDHSLTSFPAESSGLRKKKKI